MMKSQSAMEYLMTYGWAILIIAVVLAVLFQLGVFSSGNFQPHAQPGACQVSRTVAGVSLEGQCNGLLPQYVLSLNGLNPEVVGPTMTVDLNTNSYTMCAWADTLSTSLTPAYGDLLVAIQYANTGMVVDTSGGTYEIDGYMDGIGAGLGSPTMGTWQFYCVDYAGFGSTSRSLYVDGASLGAITTGSTGVYTGQMQIGNGGYTCCGWTTNPPDYVSNVQIYNTSLSQPEIQALYQEGIGGAPIRPQNLIGWWPLNGNANDYSGNGNNGQTYNSAVFISSWSSGYTAP